ncbi:ras-like protein family, member Ab [Radiomyces spectabilis]|uniref:ras-like protein family, member Ab n=1 Tax=Radiomyces spectabilis TaxID=64574 RepID=UPI00222049C0|nr:ras-like protein family, member Ab [Radiomyces spectabilis]KAI8365197.1 ras-like protein family, member Ab [Radiomyces spectabilis]
MSDIVKVKAVVIGDGGCGKTSLLRRWTDDQFTSESPISLFITYMKHIEIDGFRLDLTLQDTSGQGVYDRMRPLIYPDTDVILICFAVDLPDSLHNAYEKWLYEILQHCPNVPYVLVACKADLRNDKRTLDDLQQISRKPVTRQEGMLMAREMKAAAYIETSSKDNTGMQQPLDIVCRLALARRRPYQTKKCCYLL